MAITEIKTPHGMYYVWEEGNTIYGSGNKANATSNIVNAREIKDFTSAGFESIEEVTDYVVRYF